MIKLNGDKLWQYDLDRTIEIIPSKGRTVEMVRFIRGRRPYMLAHREEGGKIIADIPNVLLKAFGNVRCVVDYLDEDGHIITENSNFHVHKREKPAGYQYKETDTLELGEGGGASGGDVTGAKIEHYSGVVMEENELVYAEQAFLSFEPLVAIPVEGASCVVEIKSGTTNLSFEAPCFIMHEEVDMTVIGNPAMTGSEEDNGVPFLLAIVPDEMKEMTGGATAMLMFAGAAIGETIILKVAGEWDIINKIDARFLPDIPSAFNLVDGNAPGSLRMVSATAEDDTYALGEASFAEGVETKASGNYAHAEGYETKALSDYTHAEGYNTTASAMYAHAEGNYTTASGADSHAEGNNTKATKSCAHAEGYGTTADGNNSHAEGSETKARAKCAHAEGGSTDASGDYSHAEGQNSISGGESSHAEGKGCIANGRYSHAEGQATYALGQSSHAEGNGTEAETRSLSVSGEFNDFSDVETYGIEVKLETNATITGATWKSVSSIPKVDQSTGKFIIENAVDKSVSQFKAGDVVFRSSSTVSVCYELLSVVEIMGDTAGRFDYKVHNVKPSTYCRGRYANVVGNGLNADNRSNAHTLDWNGNAWFAGTMEGTAVILASPNGTRYKVTVNDSGTLSATAI